METQCVYCGGKAIQKTAKPKRFCGRRCEAKHRYHQNPEQYRAYCRKFYYKRHDYHIKRAAEWAKKHPDRAKEQNNRATRKYKEKMRYGNQRQILLKKHGGCELCGSKKRLQVHHIDRVSYHNTPTPNNNLENLRLFCQTCHLKEHWKHGKSGWKRMKRKSDTLGD